jgi:hypothetical protein
VGVHELLAGMWIDVDNFSDWPDWAGMAVDRVLIYPVRGFWDMSQLSCDIFRVARAQSVKLLNGLWNKNGIEDIQSSPHFCFASLDASP